jgi:hypothetical protein
MADGLVVAPTITATLAHRTASSDCHGAKLNPGPEPGMFTCRSCGQPCDRILSDPQEVTAHA